MIHKYYLGLAVATAFAWSPFLFTSKAVAEEKKAVAEEKTCNVHFAINLDPPLREEFCNSIKAASKKHIITIVKKPKCSPSGPRSKCNPSSMPVPDNAVGILLRLSKNNAYRATPLVIDGQNIKKGEIDNAFSEYKEFNQISAKKLGFEDGEWSLVDPEKMKDSDAMQKVLRKAFPKIEESIRQGETVIFIVPGNKDGN